jgi:pre-mRNA-splicing factor SYF2
VLIVDYTQIAEKAYQKNINGFKPDLEGYRKAKDEELAKGQLEQTSGRDMQTVDADRSFYADANSLGIADHKPRKEHVDSLVEGVKKHEQKREAQRRKKRRGDDGDVTYINKRNKNFNLKLDRFVRFSSFLTI